MSAKSNHDILTDDYVAELLAKEASDSALKYSAMGLDAFKTSKRPANQPKPNTRFLNNIIRDTNHHNRTLLAKEEADSKARLRQLDHADSKQRDDEERRERRSRPGPGDTRKRMLGDIAAILGGPSKRRKSDHDSDERSKRRRVQTDRENDERSSRRDHHYDRESRTTSPPRTDRRGNTTRNSDASSRQDSAIKNGGLRKEPKQREAHDEREPRDRDSGSRRRRRSSEDRDRSRRPHEQDEAHRERRLHTNDDRHIEPLPRKERSPNRHRDKGDESRSRNRPTTHDESDSDPLEDIIGPMPPAQTTVRRRGRGVNSATSGIDKRFATDYDPLNDASPDPDEAQGGDWDNAVEVFRDRQKMKQQGAARLRAAGFTEEQVRKWEKGDKKDESDVKWDKAGTSRAWDRGKVLDGDQYSSPDPDFGTSESIIEYGRLKGT
ncbi:hypothetical protein F5Y18DRAFT_433826 [Xylariaceae sp. FL1019]|nr:hypothetical protein F5Y18DRAFT_433826 [Xylariaceae sp. FL1019]